ncbi:MAG: hypothetical protein WBG32_19140 [Nodosilinea sp.]
MGDYTAFIPALSNALKSLKKALPSVKTAGTMSCLVEGLNGSAASLSLYPKPFAQF